MADLINGNQVSGFRCAYEAAGGEGGGDRLLGRGKESKIRNQKSLMGKKNSPETIVHSYQWVLINVCRFSTVHFRMISCDL